MASISRSIEESRTTAAVTEALLFLVHSNILISLAATGVAVSTLVLANLPLEPAPLFIVFAVTMFVYSLNRVTDLEEDEQNMPGRAAFVREYGKPLFALGIVLYLGAIAIAIVQNVPYAPAMVLPLVMAALYSLLRLKSVLLVKNLLVGLSWGAIPLGAGVFYDSLLTVDVLFVAGFVTAMLTIAAAVFDIKDIEGDRAEGITTVPIVFGVRRTRQSAATGSALVGAVVVGFLVAGTLDALYVVLLPFTAYVSGYSLVATRDRGPLFYGFVIDGEHVFLAVLLLGVDFLLL